MTPVPEITLVWVDSGGARPDGAQARALEAWAAARGARLVGLAPETREPLPYPAAVVASVEAALTRGHDAIAALDGATADEALASAEASLAAHAEVPQGAFLLAEVLRARALRAIRVTPPDEPAARAALAEAHGLDGGRVPGLGDPPESRGPAVTIDIASEGLTADDALLLDGQPLPPGRANVAPGRHQLALVSGGARVWARWLTATEGLRVAVPILRTRCAPSDVAGARLERGVARVPPGVLCARWVAARASGPDVELAACAGSACAPVVPWRVRAPDAPLAPRYVDAAVPAWAQWTAAGAVTAVVASVVLVASGALESAPRTTRFSYGGLVER